MDGGVTLRGGRGGGGGLWPLVGGGGEGEGRGGGGHGGATREHIQIMVDSKEYQAHPAPQEPFLIFRASPP